MEKKPKILVILGPTASGKSNLAVQLAKTFNGEVVSADSRQVYKSLDIGTGKITKEEMQGVPHHLLDVVQASTQYSVADYSKAAGEVIGDIISRGKLPIICGGTGFYISTLLGETAIPDVPPNPDLRRELENESAEELYKKLEGLDPDRAETIDKHNKVRLVRAIEITEALGHVPKLLASSSQLEALKYEVLKIGIEIQNEELREKIKIRIDEWFEEGLTEEVENLHKSGLSWERMSEIGLEYKLVAEYLNSKIQDIESLKQTMLEKTWQYAKRQKTWFKRDKDIVWLSNYEKAKHLVENFLNS